MGKIGFTDKVALNENASIPDINKCKASDMNEIKQVVNENDDKVGNLGDLVTPNKNNIVGAINSIVENGSNDNGSWIKFADGTMICYGSFDLYLNNFVAWGSLYSQDYENPHNFPQTFTSINTCLLENSGNAAAFISRAAYDTNGITKISPTRPTTSTATYTFSYIAIGKWK